jgi:hypothetical protein
MSWRSPVRPRRVPFVCPDRGGPGRKSAVARMLDEVAAGLRMQAEPPLMHFRHQLEHYSL